MLDEEINNYDKNINDIQKIVVINKIDLFKDTKFDDYLSISCKEGKGIDQLMDEGVAQLFILEMNNLGLMYYYGEGVSKEYKEENWYKEGLNEFMDLDWSLEVDRYHLNNQEKLSKAHFPKVFL